MAISLYKQLLLMKQRIPMTFAPPADRETVAAFRRRCPRAPDILYELWSISDGVELNVPGTVLYSAGEALERPVLGGCVPLGHMSFGDPLYLDAGGQVLQMDRRNGGALPELAHPGGLSGGGAAGGPAAGRYAAGGIETQAERREKERADNGKVRHERRQAGAMFRRGGGTHGWCGLYPQFTCGGGVFLCRTVLGGAERPDWDKTNLPGGERAPDVLHHFQDPLGLTGAEKGDAPMKVHPLFCSDVS